MESGRVIQIEGGGNYIIPDERQIEKETKLRKSHKITFLAISTFSLISAITIKNSKYCFEKGLLIGVCFSSTLAYLTHRQYPIALN